jgi:hypothetical protein
LSRREFKNGFVWLVKYLVEAGNSKLSLPQRQAHCSIDTIKGLRQKSMARRRTMFGGSARNILLVGAIGFLVSVATLWRYSGYQLLVWGCDLMTLSQHCTIAIKSTESTTVLLGYVSSGQHAAWCGRSADVLAAHDVDDMACADLAKNPEGGPVGSIEAPGNLSP